MELAVRALKITGRYVAKPTNGTHKVVVEEDSRGSYGKNIVGKAKWLDKSLGEIKQISNW